MATSTLPDGSGRAHRISLYTEIGLLKMAARKSPDEKDLHSYYQGRIEPLAKRLLDVAEDLLGKESVQQRRDFEEHVERRLQNGAKFVPRKRQPR